jgi:hypothetical protein
MISLPIHCHAIELYEVRLQALTKNKMANSKNKKGVNTDENKIDQNRNADTKQGMDNSDKTEHGSGKDASLPAQDDVDDSLWNDSRQDI